MKSADGGIRFLSIGHFHIAEALRLPGVTIGYQIDQFHCPERIKQLAKGGFRYCVAEITDV